MDDEAQARAYAEADFSEPHDYFVDLFRTHFGADLQGTVLDLGCGPGDICLRFANAYRHCDMHGIDGAEAMLRLGRASVRARGLAHRIQLLHGYLPVTRLPRDNYDAVISNSLLHHLQAPGALWQLIQTYASPGCPVFVMDLLRPDSPERARQLVDDYAGDEAEILKTDFYHSLCAAYTPAEIRQQLQAARLDTLRLEVVSDRHGIVYGRL